MVMVPEGSWTKNAVLAKASSNFPETETYVGLNWKLEEKDTSIKKTITALSDISLIGWATNLINIRKYVEDIKNKVTKTQEFLEHIGALCRHVWTSLYKTNL
jgi:hypothetical protein